MDVSYKNWVNNKAKEMRESPTISEDKFKRWINKNYKTKPLFQHPILVDDKYYILDFYFPNSRIAVEIDGSSHKNRLYEDKKRDMDLLDKKGIYTIRLYNNDCNATNLKERFDIKLNYAKSVLKKIGYKINTPIKK